MSDGDTGKKEKEEDGVHSLKETNSLSKDDSDDDPSNHTVQSEKNDPSHMS